MLVLSRRKGEKIVFPNLGVKLEVLRVQGNTARLGIHAPREVKILRDEIAGEEFAGLDVGTAAATTDAAVVGKLPHALRNRLHTASLAMHLLKRQLETGKQVEAETTFKKILKEFDSLDQEADRYVHVRQAAADAVGQAGCDQGSLAGDDPPQQRRTLVVEDDRNESELLAGFLRLSGFEVATAADGAMALDYLANHDRPDFLLLDMIMPHLDGPGTIQAIRENPGLKGLKVFAISGSDPDQLGVTTGPEGVDRWFSKPVNPQRLVREIAAEFASNV